MKTDLNSAQSPETSYTPPQPLLECVPRDALLTAHEVAQFLRVPVSWVYERTRRRGIDRLPHLKLGKYLRFSRQGVLDWLEKVQRN